ncbi:hypothetical protein AWH66_2006410 [Vibrio barjaei]|jgi:hypothetical protein|nr:hypothetical protein AWH66_2006410 [Vibrio barjaei]
MIRWLYIISFCVFFTFNSLAVFLDFLGRDKGHNLDVVMTIIYFLISFVFFYMSFYVDQRAYRFKMIMFFGYYMITYVSFLPFYAFGFSVPLLLIWSIVYIPLPIFILSLIKTKGAFLIRKQ